MLMRMPYFPGKIPLLSELAIAVLLAWMVAGWVMPDQTPVAARAPDEIKAAKAVLPDLADLVSVPLFGKFVVKPVSKPKPVARQAIQPAAPSRLNIKLLGTVVAGENSAAIILIAASHEQRVVFTGDAIEKGANLVAVEADAIVVERNGKLERISMEQSARLNVGPAPEKPLPIRAPAAPANPIRKKIDRTNLQAQIRDFPRLLSQARVVPHFVHGKSDGFVISDIVPGSLYQQVGLLNGDVIRKVNGQQVTTARQAMAMYQALQDSPSINLELMRAGQMLQVHYDIR